MTITIDATPTRLTITINRPHKRNAMTAAMWGAVKDAVEAETGERLIILQGSGGIFCAGADISEFDSLRADPQAVARYDEISGGAYRALRAARAPTLALIDGDCMGGGLAMAAACDIRIASGKARFAVPAAKLGLAYPPDAAADLVRLVGAGDAKWIFLTAEPIDAATALRMGLIQTLIDADRFDADSAALIDAIEAKARLTQIAAKSAVSAALGTGTVGQAARDAQTCFESDDYAEGRQAFRDKRKPNFTGR